MDPQRAELIATLRTEAVALLDANQRGRAAAQRTIVVTVAIVVAAILVGVAARTDDVALVLPPAVLLLLSSALQQYGDVTVLGAARAALEARLARELGGPALVYETAVAPIRKRPPLVGSVRVLQALAVVVLGAIVVTGAVVASEHRPFVVVLGFGVLTAAGLGSLALSYRDMRRSWPVASAALDGVTDAADG